MNTQDLWNDLQKAALVSGSMPQDNALDHPWYIRVLQGFAGWLAALFLLGFFAVAFAFIFKKPNSVLLFSAAISCSVFAYVLFKAKSTDFLAQFGLALSLCGQILFAIALFWSIKTENSEAYFILGFYQLLLALLLPNYMHRLLTLTFSLLTLMFALKVHGIWGLDTAVCAVAVSLIWIKEDKWGKWAEFWQAIAFASAIALVLGSVFLIGKNYLFYYTRSVHGGWFYENAPLLGSILIALVLVNVVWVILKENKINLSSKEAGFALIFSIISVLISFKVYGLSTGLLVALLGFIRHSKVLLVLGLVCIISFFSWYYYNLNYTLLYKSILLMAAGGAMIFGYWFLQRLYSKRSKAVAYHFKLTKPSTAAAVVFATVFALIVAVNINISKKESLIATGDSLLFRLAPVDPRSLMQGDYMRINFAIAGKISSALQAQDKDDYIKLRNLEGSAIVEKDKNNVVKFVKLADNQATKATINANHYKIFFKFRNYRFQLTTDAFYFQEGKAKHYNKAVYGEYRYHDGEMLLVNLIDKDFKIL